MSFEHPSDWTVSEPEDYDANDFEGWSDAKITVSKGDAVLELTADTIPARGFETTCEHDAELTAVGDGYRVKKDDGDYTYTSATTEDDEDWRTPVSGEFMIVKDDNANYCYSVLAYRVYDTTNSYDDISSSGFGYVNVGTVAVWLSANIDAEVSSDLLEEADKIIASLSQSVSTE